MHCQLDLRIWLSIDGFVLNTAASRCLADVTHLLLRILPYLDMHCFVLTSCTDVMCAYLLLRSLLKCSHFHILLYVFQILLPSSFYCPVVRMFLLPFFTAHFLNCSHFRFSLHSSQTVLASCFTAQFVDCSCFLFHCTVPRLFLLPLSLHSSQTVLASSFTAQFLDCSCFLFHCTVPRLFLLPLSLHISKTVLTSSFYCSFKIVLTSPFLAHFLNQSHFPFLLHDCQPVLTSSFHCTFHKLVLFPSCSGILKIDVYAHIWFSVSVSYNSCRIIRKDVKKRKR